MVKVSICIPAYNNEQSVRRLLASVEKQIFQDYEVIITDDSTGDGIGKLAEEKDYVKYYKKKAFNSLLSRHVSVSCPASIPIEINGFSVYINRGFPFRICI